MTASRKWIPLSLISILLVALSACATILRGTRQGIGIASQPPGAQVIIDNQTYGVTPVAAKLTRKDNHHIVIQLEGYEPYEITLTRQASGWVFGNILFCLGAPIGIAIDAIAGGMYTLKPGEAEAQLRPNAKTATSDDETLFVVLTERADTEWLKIGQLQQK
jgi:hypothetical protein